MFCDEKSQGSVFSVMESEVVFVLCRVARVPSVCEWMCAEWACVLSMFTSELIVKTTSEESWWLFVVIIMFLFACCYFLATHSIHKHIYDTIHLFCHYFTEKWLHTDINLVSSWSVNISVWFCLRATGYGLTVWCAILDLLVGDAIQVSQLQLQICHTEYTCLNSVLSRTDSTLAG